MKNIQIVLTTKEKKPLPDFQTLYQPFDDLQPYYRNGTQVSSFTVT